MSFSISISLNCLFLLFYFVATIINITSIIIYYNFQKIIFFIYHIQIPIFNI